MLKFQHQHFHEGNAYQTGIRENALNAKSKHKFFFGLIIIKKKISESQVNRTSSKIHRSAT